jgi:hypothetical protein
LLDQATRDVRAVTKNWLIDCNEPARNLLPGWAPETARREAKVQVGRVAGGEDPVEDRQLDHKAITVKELCTRYLADLQARLILGKGGRPKKPSTITTDTGRIERHIIPLIGTRRVKDPH